jgi:signal transduction histidine kinase
VPITDDLRTRTTLVCGALALAIAISSVLRGRRRVHWLFAAFAADIGLWYLSQSLFGLFQSPIWARLRVALALFLPVFAINLFESIVPAEAPRRARLGRWVALLTVPMLGLAVSPYMRFTGARVAIFVFVGILIAAGLYQLGQRGRHSQSRVVQRRVRFVVVIGALAALLSAADFGWVIGAAFQLPPVGALLSVVFLFMLAQALQQKRLLDLYELVGRLIVAMVVATVIASLFYVLVLVVGRPSTMYLNAVLVAIVVLVLFDPLRSWVEQRIQSLVFRERGRLEAALATARRRLAHTLQLDDLGKVVMGALERSRSVTDAALYLLLDDGAGFEQLAQLGDRAPARIEIATANALLEQLQHGSVVIEQIERAAREKRSVPPGHQPFEAVLAAAEVLDPLRGAVVLGIRAESRDLIGLLVLLDDRVRDAFSPEDVALLEALAGQVGVVVENSQVYTKMKERDRLAVLGQMAAGLAHEIRNPLGAIKGAAQLLLDSPAGPGDTTASEFLDIIVEEVDRLDGVVGSMLDLARQRPDKVPPLDVNGEVRRTLQVIGAETGQSVRIHTQLAEQLPRVAIGADQLRQVLLNLVRNACEATQDEGPITVTTDRLLRGKESWVRLRVHDKGPGMSRAMLQKIFLPFFTTKGRGTGLGLAICQRIVQTAGGRIEARSREGEGATFTVSLPVAMDPLGTPVPSTSGALTEKAAATPADQPASGEAVKDEA